MRALARFLLAMALALGANPVLANFHLWTMNEVYSNADGSVQFLELTVLSGGQQFLNLHTLSATDGSTTHNFTFPNDLPGDTAGKKFLVGTTGFAALGIVTPDYVVPNGFFFRTGGSINFAGVDIWAHGALPAGTVSLNRDGSTATATPTNFAGATGSLPAPSSAVGISPSPVAFGNTSMNTSSPPNLVTITNNSGAPITIASVTVTGDFVVMPSCGALGIGASCEAGMYFTPTGEGVRNGTLTVTSDAPGSPHTAPVTGTGERSLVTHYYQAILNRAPDAPGKAYWESEAIRLSGLGIDINETWYVMAGYFFNSPEYLSFNKTNAQYVTDLYFTFFNRAPDDGGLAYWLDQIASGMPREVVLYWFMFSPEFRNFTTAIFGNTTSRPEVNMVVDFFRGLLNRLPDTPSFDYWLQQLKAAQCQGPSAVYLAVDSISHDFMFSLEYGNRQRTTPQLVSDMYDAFLRRGGDLGGVPFWINELQTGARSANQVRTDFIASPEFGARVQAVIDAGCAP